MSDPKTPKTSFADFFLSLLKLVFSVFESALRVFVVWRMYAGWLALPVPSYVHALAISCVWGFVLTHGHVLRKEDLAYGRDRDHGLFVTKMIICWLVVGVIGIVRLCIGAGPYAHAEAL